MSGVKLTPKDRLVLDYILKNPETACFLTAAELAAKLKVSASSVVRVSTRLGYENFTAFRRALQQAVAEERKKAQGEIPYERIKNSAELSEEELITVIQSNVLRHIEKDQTAANHAEYRKAASLIGSASRVYLVGFRCCAGFADSFGVMLGCVRPGVFVVNGSRPMVDSLVDLTPEDVVVAFSFERYSSDTVFAARMAREAGAHLVALTDKYTSPLCTGAEAVILCSADGLSFYNSYTALVMAMEVLTGLVSHRKKEQNESRLKKMEEYLKETGQY
ncbi:MAG: MurR/RpiR family transcriptional regulator [Clostridium sp.]|nr:MurR/RpiR family transcriptional regulator [Clostridium sp.]